MTENWTIPAIVVPSSFIGTMTHAFPYPTRDCDAVEIAGRQRYMCEDGHWRETSERTCQQPKRDPAELLAHCGAVVRPLLIPHDFTDVRYLFPALETWIGDREIQVSIWR